MDLATLRDHVRTLATLPERSEPMVSCTLDLSRGRHDAEAYLESRRGSLLAAAAEPERRLLDAAFQALRAYLGGRHAGGVRGLALYCRAGEEPFFLPLSFHVPLKNWISVDTLPSVNPLVELEDRHHRFVVLHVMDSQARIYEVNLGAATEALWLERPELRTRVGREWTRLHYRNSRRDQDRRFVKEAFETARRLMDESGHSHLVLAGTSRVVGELRAALPADLEDRLVDLVRLGADAGVDDVVGTTLASFLQAEEAESHSALEELQEAFHKHDLAVLGHAPSLQALLRRRASMLVIDRDAPSASAHLCTDCGWVAVGDPAPQVCAECPSTQLLQRDARAELVRLAVAQGCPVETVEGASTLSAFDGVGVMLRYAHAYTRDSRQRAVSA